MPYSPPSAHADRRKVNQKEWRQTYDERRGSSTERGYDASWQRVRKHQLLLYPLCYDCLQKGKYTPAKEIHHRLKLKDYPELRDEPSNLMSLCKECHTTRTRKGE